MCTQSLFLIEQLIKSIVHARDLEEADQAEAETSRQPGPSNARASHLVSYLPTPSPLKTRKRKFSFPSTVTTRRFFRVHATNDKVAQEKIKNKKKEKGKRSTLGDISHPSHFLFFLSFSLYLSLETLNFFFKTVEEKFENGFSECYMCSGSCIGVECVSGISGRHSSPRREHSYAAWLQQQICAGTKRRRALSSSCLLNFVYFIVFFCLSRTYCLDDEKTEGK